MSLKLAINGFGRIGRNFFKQAFENPEIEILAINDLGDPEKLAYLLKYDSVYGRYSKRVEVLKEEEKVGNLQSKSKLLVEDKKIIIFQEPNPENLPWGELNIDVVVESTGFFTSKEKAQAHLKAGAKRVVISAPAKDEITPTFTPGINEFFAQEDKITSNASCTTNATTPVVAILQETIGIEKGMLTTVHGYTSTQNLVDGPSKGSDLRRGRAGAQNIVPSSTGAAKAVERVIPELKGRFDGIAFRVPVISGSIIDFTCITKRETTVEEINEIFKKAEQNPRWKGIIKTTEEPLVSTDILKEPYGSIVDLSLTRVVGGNLVKVCAWYDNEWGYCAMLLKHILALEDL